MKIKGSGTNGKRLWLRSKDKRWIEVPYGANQDHNIRSVNIWDGYQWVVPSWGWYFWQRLGYNFFVNFPIDSLDVRAPGVKWPTNSIEYSHIFNPNYIAPEENYPPFNVDNDDWLRLFHVEPRNDPNWLIVPIRVLLPNRVPNQCLNLFDFHYYRAFWPAVGRTRGLFTNGVETASGGFDAMYGARPLFFLVWSRKSNSNPAYHTGPGPFPADSEFRDAGCLDFKAIRQRLVDSFPGQNTFLIGQYKPISEMLLRRAFVKVTFHIDLSITAYQDPTVYLENVAFRIWRQTNHSTVTIMHKDEDWGPDYREVQCPSAASPAGVLEYEIRGTDLDFDAGVVGQDEHGNDIYLLTVYQELPDAVVWTYTAPGEDNICFYPEIAGLPSVGDPQVVGNSAEFQVTLERVVLNYSVAGHDVPDDKQSIDVIG